MAFAPLDRPTLHGPNMLLSGSCSEAWLAALVGRFQLFRWFSLLCHISCIDKLILHCWVQTAL